MDFDVILNYATLWGPSVAAILGILATVLLSLAKVMAAVKSFTNENFMKSVEASYVKNKESNDEIKQEMRALMNADEQLREQNRLLLEEITRIKGYGDVGEKKQ